MNQFAVAQTLGLVDQVTEACQIRNKAAARFDPSKADVTASSNVRFDDDLEHSIHSPIHSWESCPPGNSPVAGTILMISNAVFSILHERRN